MMKTTEALILLAVLLVALFVQSVYFLIDDRTENHTPQDLKLKKYWHWAGGAVHIWSGYVMYRLFGWQWGLLTASTTWYFFDGCINSFVLHREWWYIGTTAWLDIAQRKIADAINIEPRLFSAILKNIFLIFSIISFLL